MSVYNRMAMKLVALDCLAFVEAHAKRNPLTEWPTMNERETLRALEHRLAVLRREDAKATAGKAA